MATRATAYVTPEVLRWAREAAACTLDEAGRAVQRPPEVVASWESPDTDTLPTVRQAQRLARAYGVPFALLYLEHPNPDLTPAPVPEFRQLNPDTRMISPQSRQLRRMVRQAQERQTFAVELLEAAGQPPLPWVGSANVHENPESLGRAIRESLVRDERPPDGGNRDRILDWWAGRVEVLGAIVSRYRPDGNRYRVVEPAEARGLSLCHPLAPYIVLNSRDAPSGRLFTLMHELAHIYFGQCGIDDIGDERLLPADARFLEQRCNHVAAAILMPAAQFRTVWSIIPGDVGEKVAGVADRFGVSRQAAAVRAAVDDIDLINPDQYRGLSGYLADEYREFRNSREGVSSGGSMPVPVRVLKDYGTRYVELVFDALSDGQLSLLDTAEVLGVRIGDVEQIQRRVR